MDTTRTCVGCGQPKPYICTGCFTRAVCAVIDKQYELNMRLKRIERQLCIHESDDDEFYLTPKSFCDVDSNGKPILMNDIL